VTFKHNVKTKTKKQRMNVYLNEKNKVVKCFISILDDNTFTQFTQAIYSNVN